ncbi:MAG: hypothetical protein KDC38_06825, partial [Planctomycetes bacterium]|nr:hypothetical protein [Planctomycetota bacterium]
DEAFLRNLEAYYLTARRHDIPVLFTFFAFVPESFGGASPYFDPRSREAQEAYVGAIASRFAEAKEILWDFINEPSFASPDKLWQARPHGDPYEERAFRTWLEQRYADAPGGWEAEVRSRWRLRPDEPIGLPVDDDFADRPVFAEHRPYRAKEWVHFSQDAFVDWVRAMTRAVRAAGSNAPVTVGQDEGGLLERPHPLFHADVVDFTSIHSWWFNDALYFDGVFAKAPDRPLLVSETGIMNREALSGEAFRRPSTAAELLSRKIGYSFAAGAFGVIDWCYHVNPTMDSDNEVAIGLRRVDGSYKPEHVEWRRFARFFRDPVVAATGLRPPRVALILPYSDHVGARGRQVDRAKRTMELFGRELHVAVQVVPEYRTAGALVDDLGAPRYGLIILPSCSGIADAAWRDLTDAVDRGAVLLGSGFGEADDAGRPAERWGGLDRELASIETVDLGDGSIATLHHTLDDIESVRAAQREELVVIRERGRGQQMHCALPLELALEDTLRRQVYREALRVAGVEPAISVAPPSPALLVRALEFASSTWVVIVNEGHRATGVTLGVRGRSHLVSAPSRQAMVLVFDAAGELIRSTHRGP